jgi:VanZ family protein
MSKTIKILIALACSLLVVSAIFFFSEQSGEESHEKSGKVASSLAKTIADMSNGAIKDYELRYIEKALDYPVRKFAHLSIYFGLGFVFYLSAVLIQNGKKRPLFILVCLVLVVLVASADEINQFFKDGRGASFKDVLIDTAGGALGVYFYYILTDFAGHVKALFKGKDDHAKDNS